MLLRLHTGIAGPLSSQSQIYVMNKGQSVSQSWCQTAIWDLRPDFYYCETVAGFFIWGALCDERTSLPFTIAAGSLQHSHSRVQVTEDRDHILLSQV
jgi:hypothetical protein